MIFPFQQSDSPHTTMILVAPAAVLLVAVTIAETVTGGAAAKEVPLVDTDGGLVSGILEETLKGREFYSFYGIPFAQPPLGKLRFLVTYI